MKHRRILFGLLLSFPLVLAGGAFVNSATIAEPVEVGATTSTYYVDYGSYLDDSNTLYVYAWYTSGETDTNVYGAWPGAAVGSETYPNAITVDTTTNVATINLDSTAQYFIVHTNNNNQTADITVSEASGAEDTFIISGSYTDTSSTPNKTVYTGVWESDLEWHFLGGPNQWVFNSTTAFKEGTDYQITLAGEQHFKIIAGTNYSGSSGCIYEIGATTSFPYNNTSSTLLTLYPDWFKNYNSGTDIYVAASGSNTFTFTFSKGLALALRRGNDVGELLKVTSETSTTATISYYPIIVDNAESPTTTSICFSDSITASSTATLATVEPNPIYGYTFKGWYYETGYAIDTSLTVGTVAGYNNVRARFTINTEDMVTYKIDYSAALQYAYPSTDMIFVRYWNDTDGMTFPGVNLGSGLTSGVVETTIPTGATKLILSAYYQNDDGYPTNKHNQTIDIEITPSTSATKEVFLSGIYNEASGDDYAKYFAYEADAGYVTIRTALAGLATTCANTSQYNPASTVHDDITSAWKTISGTTTAHADCMKTMVAYTATGIDSSSIAACLSRYDYIIGKYTTLTDPLVRKKTTTDPVSAIRLDIEETEPYIALIAFVSASVLIIGSYIFIKKKLEKRIEE